MPTRQSVKPVPRPATSGFGASPADPDMDTDSILSNFIAGRIGRKTAMAQLGVPYGTLIDMVGERGATLPTVSADRLEVMAKVVTDILDAKDGVKVDE